MKQSFTLFPLTSKNLVIEKKVSKTQNMSIYCAEVNVFKVELEVCCENMGCMVEFLKQMCQICKFAKKHRFTEITINFKYSLNDLVLWCSLIKSTMCNGEHWQVLSQIVEQKLDSPCEFCGQEAGALSLPSPSFSFCFLAFLMSSQNS